MSGLLPREGDRRAYQLRMLASHGLKTTDWRAGELMGMEPERREELAALARELDVRIGLTFGFDYFSDSQAEIEQNTRSAIEAVQMLAPLFRSPACVTGIRGRTSFDRDMPVARQIERLSPVLAPLAAAAHEQGCPLGLHNSGYYCSDLAELCARTPHLGILFDTGNPFLVGERPVRAAEAAAPHTVGTHFKDHHVRPDKQARPLCLQIKGAVVGSGNAGISEIFDILVENAPNVDEMPMLMEIDPVDDMKQPEALEKSLEFVRGLQNRLDKIAATE